MRRPGRAKRGPGPITTGHTGLMVRSARRARLEPWGRPSFETHRFAMLLRMRRTNATAYGSPLEPALGPAKPDPGAGTTDCASRTRVQG